MFTWVRLLMSTIFGTAKNIVGGIPSHVFKKLLIGIITVLVLYGTYCLGYAKAEADFTIKMMQQKIEMNDVHLKEVEKIYKENSVLSNKLIKLTAEKGAEDAKINTKADDIVDKYAKPSSVQQPTSKSDTETTSSVRPARKTQVVVRRDTWKFSARDREKLIREAARADRVTNELNQCKLYVNQIYASHAKYKQEVERYNRQLK